MDVETWPTQRELTYRSQRLPTEFYPSVVPQAVVVRNALSRFQCAAIVEQGLMVPFHKHDGCNAYTREFPRPLPNVLNNLRRTALYTNDLFFKFDLNNTQYDGPMAWMQTYTEGCSYNLHTDGAPGYSRKLTAVLQLSDPSEYEGGELVLLDYPKTLLVPKERGTVVVFPAWVLHNVSQVTKGMRRSINLGFFGPPFK